MIELDQRSVNIIDRGSPEPYYRQIKGWMLGEMTTGRWPTHYKLPSEPDLAGSLGVSRGTLRAAIREMINERRLTQVHGKGTFVTSPDHIEEPLANHLMAFSEELILQNIPFRTEVVNQRILAPDSRVAALLSVSTNEPVLYLKRRRFVDDAPIILTENYVPLTMAPGIEREDFTKQRLFQCLEDRYGHRLLWARRTFEARRATAEQARVLALRSGEPVMYIEQIVYLAGDRPVEFSDIWLRSDRFRLSSIIARDGRSTSRTDRRPQP